MRSEALSCEPPQTAQVVPPAPVGTGRSGRTLARARPLRAALAYRGGNCECGAGGARLAVGAWAVKPITAQLMSTPTEPYGVGLPVAGLTPVSRSGRVAARLNTTFSSICRLLSPCLT